MNLSEILREVLEIIIPSKYVPCNIYIHTYRETHSTKPNAYFLTFSWKPKTFTGVYKMAAIDPPETSGSMTFSTYLHSLSQTPKRLKKRILATWTPDQEVNKVRLRSGADMKRKLTWYDLVALGVGGMLGVGVFVTTGPVALDISGPSVFISYIIAGISALLSSLCYTEFSIEIPVAGGAFSYLRVTFGKENNP